MSNGSYLYCMLDSLRWIGYDICAWSFNNIGFCEYQGHLCGADAFRVSIEFDECIRFCISSVKLLLI